MGEFSKLVEVVGKKYVRDDPETLEACSRDESFVPPVRPLGVVMPGSLEEVDGIIKWANETNTPLVPVSSGPPHFRGDTIPSVGGAMVVDLTRMKKIMRVDFRNKLSMIEPGVTFGELIPALAKENLAPVMPLAPRATKSVLAAALERDPIVDPHYHWEFQEPLRCAELVFGNGELFRTGSAAGPGTLEEQWAAGRAQSRPSGPSFADFGKLIQAAQGTMGIVTWATITARPLGSLRELFCFPSDDLVNLINFVYKILWRKLGTAIFLLNGKNLACLVGQDSEETESLSRELPEWLAVVSIEGFGSLPEQRFEYEKAETLETAQYFGLESDPVLAGIKRETILDIISRPSEEPYWKVRSKGGCKEIFFITQLENTPEFIARVFHLAASCKVPTADIGVYIQPTVHGTNCHCEFDIMYDPGQAFEVERVKALDSEAAVAIKDMHGFFSRPYGSWARLAYSSPETVVIQRKLKGIFDPNDIMNPGKLCF